jgi:hypothetical protein
MENQLLKEYIQKQVKSLLKESVTDEVYHFTTLSSIISILKDDIFYLKYGEDDDYINGYNYLSLSRTKSSKTGFYKLNNDWNEKELYDLDFIVRLKLDGRKLSQTYKGQPFNHFKFANKDDRNFEYEDRILSNKDRIENFSKYIIQIDIKKVDNYYEDVDYRDPQEIIDELQNLCNQRNIKLNIVNPNKIDRNYLEEYIQKQVKKILKEEIKQIKINLLL